MTTAVAATHPYLLHLLEGQSGLAAAPTDALKALRARALERVSALTVPTLRDEDWRFTDLAPFTQKRFQPAGNVPRLDAQALAAFAPAEAVTRLVFVDGVFQADAGGAPSGVTVTALSGADAATRTRAAALGTLAGFEHQVFPALNTAYLREAALVLVPCGVAAAAPVHLLFVSTQTGVAVYPRVLVVAEAGAAVTVIEDYVALGGTGYFNNAVTEVALGDDAQVKHYKIQREAPDSYHFATTAVRLGRNARYEGTALSFGARLSRHDPLVEIAGEGAACDLAGLALISGRQLADTHSTIDHAVPHGQSRQLHKTIAAGGAHAVFNGRIVVRPGAQLTNSGQQSRNLLLSGKARVDTKPQLEIFADDVKCAHGATVGQLDADELFYLRSRGLDETAARNLLTYAFGAEVVERIALPSLKQRLAQLVLAGTSGK
ncbi:MAG: Fe-S cluster assembly protein SufD [Burkholderiales bacterium]